MVAFGSSDMFRTFFKYTQPHFDANNVAGQGSASKVDGSFIATLLETICVWLLYLAWKNITEGKLIASLLIFS